MFSQRQLTLGKFICTKIKTTINTSMTTFNNTAYYFHSCKKDRTKRDKQALTSAQLVLNTFLEVTNAIY